MHWFCVTLLANFSLYLCLRVKFHNSLFSEKAHLLLDEEVGRNGADMVQYKGEIKSLVQLCKSASQDPKPIPGNLELSPVFDLPVSFFWVPILAVEGPYFMKSWVLFSKHGDPYQFGETVPSIWKHRHMR